MNRMCMMVVKTENLNMNYHRSLGLGLGHSHNLDNPYCMKVDMPPDMIELVRHLVLVLEAVHMVVAMAHMVAAMAMELELDKVLH